VQDAWNNKIVYVPLGHGRFREQQIKLGCDSGRLDEVLAGLKSGEPVHCVVRTLSISIAFFNPSLRRKMALLNIYRVIQFTKTIKQDANKMEYALGLSLTAVSAFVAIWINDHFHLGGDLKDER